MSEPPTQQITQDDVQDIKQFYDDVYHANAVATQGKINRHFQRLHDKLGISANSNVLDIACGAGSWLKVCHDRGAQVSGVDISTKAIAVCRERIPAGTFYDQPAETLPFDDDTFDVITCLGSLEHFIDPSSSVREMVRVAKADAVFCILVPNKDFLTRKLGLFGGTYQVAAKEVVRTLEEWDALLTGAGLQVDARWKDLHVLNKNWITQGKPIMWPARALQALMLPLWPLRWQYQVYHRCVKRQPSVANSK